MTPPPFIAIDQSVPSYLQSMDQLNAEEEVNATQVADGADDLRLNCAHRGCKREDGGEVLCAAPDCSKVIHHGCYEYLYVVGKSLNRLPNNQVACTKSVMTRC